MRPHRLIPALGAALVAACANVPPRGGATASGGAGGSDAAVSEPDPGGRPLGAGGQPVESAGGDTTGGAIATGGDPGPGGGLGAGGDTGGAGGEGGTYTPPGVIHLTGAAATGACIASPAGEGVDRLFDADSNTKFLASSNAPWAWFDAGAPYTLSHYAVTSANDSPERDPARWTLEGSNDTVEWTTLDVQVGQHFAGRFERHEHAANLGGFHRWYRFRMENAGGDRTQLAELELFGTTVFESPAAAAPSAPVALRAEAASRRALVLDWTDTSADEIVFRIERAFDGGRFAPIGYVPADNTRFTVAGLEPGVPAGYRVVAENAAGASAPTEVVVAAPLPALVGRPQGRALQYSEAGYTLSVTDDAPGRTPPGSIARMVEEFFATYPQMAADFNPGAPRAITLQFDPTYEGVAEAGGDHIRVSSAYTASVPDDIDVIVHEGFHLVQAYSFGNVPGWATEGLADYVRWAYGRQNNGACWTMQRYAPGHQYTDAYGVTARFFLWLESAHGPGLMRDLDTTLRSGAYDDTFWTSRTGQSVDALWAAYAADGDQPPVSYE